MKKFTFVLSLLIATAITTNAQWQPTSGPDVGEISSLVTNGTQIFAGTYDDGVFLSTDNGDSWIAVNNGLTNPKVSSFAISETNIFAGTWGSGVFLSTNNGDSWVEVNNGLTNFYVSSLAIDGTNIFAGTNVGVFISNNYGNSWTATGLSNLLINKLAISGTNIFAGTSGDGVFMSVDNGSSWNAIGLSQEYITSMVTIGTSIIATIFQGPYLSTNNGNSWITFGNGLPYGYYIVTSFAIGETYLFAGTSGKGVYKRPLSEIVGIEEITNKKDIAVYPNPAADFFTLNIDRDNQANIILNIYNLNGSSVRTEMLQNNQQEINISKLNAGIYIVEVKSINFSRKQKLVIQR